MPISNPIAGNTSNQAPFVEYFEVQAAETQIIPTRIISNFSLCKVYWNGVLQRYPADYQVQPARVTLLFPRIERAIITLEYYPA